MHKDPRLLVQSAPLLEQGMTTPRAMRDVVYALVPCLRNGSFHSVRSVECRCAIIPAC